MAGFKNREELLDLLLDETESVIEELVKQRVEGNNPFNGFNKLEKLHSRIINYRSMNPKEDIAAERKMIEIGRAAECAFMNFEEFGMSHPFEIGNVSQLLEWYKDLKDNYNSYIEQ